MTLRRKLVVYLLLLHAILAGLTIVALRASPWVLFPLEALLLTTLGLGLALTRSLFRPLDALGSAADLLSDGDFMSRVAQSGQPELDRLVRVYNRMAETLSAERARLQEKHYFLEKLVAASPAGILILDLDDRVDSANPSAARILGIGAPELAGKRLEEVAPPLGPSLAAIAEGQPRMLGLQGARRVRAARAHFFDSGFARAFLVLEELTDDVRRVEKAAYEKVIRMMAHEVNNSVAAARSLIESCLAFRKLLPDAEGADFAQALDVVLSRERHLAAFVKGYADVVRLPAPRTRPEDVRAIVEDVTRVMRAELDRRAIAARIDVAEPLPPVALDRPQIEQVFVNLLKNAAEAIGSGGEVVWRLGRTDGHPSVTLEDSGPGVPDDARDGLFTPFHSTKDGGQGLGLTLVQEILVAHGFQIRFENAPTRFSVVFAWEQARGAAVAAPPG